MIRSILKKLALLLIFLAMLAGGVFYTAATRWHSKEAKEISVASGASLRSIAKSLSDNGVIRTPKLFEVFVRFSGRGGKLRAGTYDFPSGVTMIDAAKKLIRGEVREYDVTMVEGWTIAEMAKALAGQPYLASADVPEKFVQLAKDKAFASSLGLSELDSLEGFLFPDTYRVTYPLSADQLIKRMVGRFKEVWNSLIPDGKIPAGRNMKEVVTLASIVEKESGAADERALIAGVFENRLAKKMPLQSDPTIIYGLPNYDGNIRAADIKNPHSYNTYVHAGLPIGPISNPGKASLEAVLHPKGSDYLYFVSRNDGTHVFSATLADHSKAVRRYQVNGEGRKQ